jgi:hypothetical protein
MPGINLGGAAAGGVGGASAGSIFGPVGTAVGGVLGAIGGLFGKKKKPKQKKVGTFDPQQQALYNDYIQGIRGQGQFSDLYNFDAEGYNNVFDQTIGRKANRNFQENVIPGITGQFRQGNLMQSSYAGDALARAGRDVQENLDALRSQNIFQGQQQAQVNKANAMNSVLGLSSSAYLKPQERTPSSIDQILGTLAPDSGQWLADTMRDLRSRYSRQPAA